MVNQNDIDEFKKQFNEKISGIESHINNQEAKADRGKLQISLVPTQIIKDVAEVRMYGNEKYGDPNNWKTVEKQRYVDALLRHLLAYVEDPDGVDEESGIPHYKHAACNMAFLCEMEKWKNDRESTIMIKRKLFKESYDNYQKEKIN